MRQSTEHQWNVTPKEAVDLQRQLAPRVVTADAFGIIHTVAGVDVGFKRRSRRIRAAIVVLSWPSLERIDAAVAEQEESFPYVPGLLSFREVPAVLDCYERLRVQPDLLVCDGQGYAHPRRFGLACHLGVVLNLPTIGAAKSRLIGTFEEPGWERGSRSPLVDRDELIGSVVRTRTGVKPLFVSVGHRVGLETATEIVLAAAPRYRLPETTRQAHRLASYESPGRSVS